MVRFNTLLISFLILANISCKKDSGSQTNNELIAGKWNLIKETIIYQGQTDTDVTIYSTGSWWQFGKDGVLNAYYAENGLPFESDSAPYMVSGNKLIFYPDIPTYSLTYDIDILSKNTLKLSTTDEPDFIRVVELSK